MVKIVGISSFYEDAKLLEMIVGHNPKIFCDSSVVKIVQRYKFSRSNTYGVKMEIDADSFSKCMTLQRIRIQWKMCKFFEAFGIIRCFHCNEFNYVSAKCTSDVTCAKCGGSHKVTECNSTDFNCINCKKAAE